MRKARAILEEIQDINIPVYSEIHKSPHLKQGFPHFSLYAQELNDYPKKIILLGGKVVTNSIMKYIHESQSQKIQISLQEITDPLRDIDEYCGVDELQWTRKNKSKLISWEYQSAMKMERKIKARQRELQIESMKEISLLQKINDFPQESFFFLGNSLVIRDFIHYMSCTRQHSFFSNRGSSGIDGNMATFWGISEAYKDKPGMILLGDLSFLYDLNSLTLFQKKRISPLFIVVINNGGGGIFHHLPIVKSKKEVFESCFYTPHGQTSFKKIADQFSLKYIEVDEAFSFIPYLETSKTYLVELRVDPKVSLEYLKVWKKILE